jgi:methenyltetrahydromethanopterin cyclohydrolase
MGLNERGYEIAAGMVRRADALAVACHDRAGVRVLDCGVAAAGGDEAGLEMARVALGGAGSVTLLPAAEAAGEAAWPGCPRPTVRVTSEQAVAACLAAQYAGWKVSADGYFAMASGPMRAAIGREDLFDDIGPTSSSCSWPAPPARPARSRWPPGHWRRRSTNSTTSASISRESVAARARRPCLPSQPTT